MDNVFTPEPSENYSIMYWCTNCSWYGMFEIPKGTLAPKSQVCRECLCDACRKR